MIRKTPAAFGAILVLISAIAGPERATNTSGARSAPPPGASGSVRSETASQDPPGALPERAASVTLIAGGDVSFGRRTGQRLLRDAQFDPFRGVAAVFATGDLRFVNLESTLSDQNGETEHPTRPLTFTGPPGGARALARAGIDLVSVANNHAWDYGAPAFFQTLTHLEHARVAYVGGSREPVSALLPRVVNVRGWSTAWFAVTDIWNTGEQTARAAAPHVAFARIDDMIRAVKLARSRYDLVLVSYHGGAEYSEHVAREQRDFARAVMQAGADALIGHHPHVPQGIEWFDRRPVLYSLGNLVFNQHRDHAWTGRGFLARLRFEPGRPAHLELCPYHVTDDGPVAVSNDDGQLEPYRRHLKRIGSYAGFSDVGAPTGRGCLPVAPREPIALATQSRQTAETRAD